MRLRKTFVLCIFVVIFMMQMNVQAYAAGDVVAPSSIVLENGSTYSIDLVDEEREQGKITIYTRNFGEYTEPFPENVYEFVVVNNIVTDKNTDGRGTHIPLNGYVISYTGDSMEFINNINIGEKVTLVNLEIPSLPDRYFKLRDLVVPIDAVNSVRSTNYIVVYDSSYGESTKTNAWGMELTVVDGAVCNIVDLKNDKGIWIENNSTIPPKGVVISIHSGSPFYDKLHESVKIGDTVKISVDNIKPYSAGKITYDALNPMSLEDNPRAWDEKKGKPYDGFRGPDQMIIYDSSYGSHTGTNPYGYEIVVGKDGKIIKTSGNNSQIPDEGFVISSHGVKSKWLQNYARLGSTVILNKEKNEIRFVFTPDSYVDMATYSIKLAQDRLDFAKAQYMDIDYDNVQKMIYKAQSKMQDVYALLREGQYRELIKTVKDIQDDATLAYYMIFESTKVENRAVWHRPRETSIDEVRKHLDMLKDININTIYLETYWNGYSIYPTDNKIMKQNPIYGGFDVLEAYIKEAHARGMELHAWVEDFLVSQNVAEKKPKWMIMSRQGDNYFTDSAGIKYYYLNPALPEVHDFLSELYKDLIKKYDIDGIQLDYIRYPESGDYSNDFGYDSYTRQLFENHTGTDPISLSVEDELWQQWCEFRANIINSFAYRIISEVKSLKPDIQISADVRPDYDSSVIDIFQDPKDWVVQDYLNILIPMSYYHHEEPVIEDIKNTQAFAQGHTQVNVGIATTTKIDPKILLRQIDAIRAASANGVGIFEFQSLFSGSYDNVLKLGVFRYPAMVTNRDPEQSISLILQDIIRKIDDIYIKNGGMNDEEAQKYKKLVEEIKVDFKDSKDAAKSADLLKNKLEDLINVIDSDETLNRQVAARISTDLITATNIVDEYISSLRFMANHKVKEFQVVMPIKVLKGENEAPLKVRAMFDDNSSAIMYLDSTQYEISTSDPTVAAIYGDVLKINQKGNATITIEILDSFKFNTAKDVDKNIRFTVDTGNEDIVASSDLGVLTASMATDTEVILNWSGVVVDSDIVGYTIYRDGKEIARVSDNTFIDKDIKSDEVYIYKVYGFNISGETIYKSNKITIGIKEKE